MASLLESRFYLTADCGGRVETSNGPDGHRVWACSSCEMTGQGEDNGRTHAAGCTTTGGNLPHDHWS
ncbi:hypothetical protein ACF1BE_15215 [Streptomyces sp. NPDC014991]|uniref:hypothetical protein n=1 Tax=Streptomyces sp. NPDC014991 TaxID=3364935 RepID=UPI0036F54086